MANRRGSKTVEKGVGPNRGRVAVQNEGYVVNGPTVKDKMVKTFKINGPVGILEKATFAMELALDMVILLYGTPRPRA